MKYFSIISLAIFAGISVTAAQAQTAATRVTGTVTTVKAAEKEVIVSSDKGSAVTLSTSDRTFVLRMPPGETDMKKAVKMALSEVAPGDRLVASGQMSSDQKTFDAHTIMILTKSDIAAIHQKEQEDWQKRGTTGIAASVDPAAQVLTLKQGPREITVKPGPKTEMLRYALDSAKLADAKPSKFADIKPGDEVHVLGNHEGDTIAAEKIVSGSFKQIAATITAIDTQTGLVTVKDLASKDKKATLTIKVTTDSTMRKLPDQMAAMLAMRYAPGRGQGGSGDAAGGGRGRGGDGAGGGMMRPTGQPGGNGGPGGPGRGMGRGGRGGDLKAMLDNLPAVPLTSLKAGDAIMITTTEGTDASHVTAIMLLAGVEPLLTASPTATRDIMSGWNLGGGGGGEGN